LAIDITNSFLKLAIVYFAATAGNWHHFSNPQVSTICECSTFGTFAVEAEFTKPASYGPVFTWSVLSLLGLPGGILYNFYGRNGTARFKKCKQLFEFKHLLLL
jgi:hypothetical protein